MKDLNELEKNKHLISELQKDKNGNDIRMVNDKNIIQAKEETEADREFNRMANLWRMRNI